MSIRDPSPNAKGETDRTAVWAREIETGGGFAGLLEHFEHDIRTVILSHVPDWTDAQDVFQETCIRLLEKQAQWEQGDGSPAAFRAWAVTVAYYQVLTYRKTRGRDRNRFSEQAMELIQQEQQASSLDRELRLERLVNCIAKLSLEGQELLRLAYGNGFSLRKVAAHLDRTEASTYKLHSRIRSLLRACVDGAISEGK